MVGLILYGRKLNRLPVRAEDVHLAGPGLTEDLGGPDVLAGAGFIPLRAVEGGCIQRNNSEALSLVALPIGDIENRSGLQSHPNQPAAGRARAGEANPAVMLTVDWILIGCFPPRLTATQFLLSSHRARGPGEMGLSPIKGPQASRRLTRQAVDTTAPTT